MTNRYDCGTEEIIKTYWAQSDIEDAFKNLKNPYYLTLKPQYQCIDTLLYSSRTRVICIICNTTQKSCFFTRFLQNYNS